MQPIKETKEHLLQTKNALERRIRSIRSDYSRGLSTDLEEQASELENAEVQEKLLEQAYEELDVLNQKLYAFRDLEE